MDLYVALHDGRRMWASKQYRLTRRPSSSGPASVRCDAGDHADHCVPAISGAWPSRQIQLGKRDLLTGRLAICPTDWEKAPPQENSLALGPGVGSNTSKLIDAIVP